MAKLMFTSEEERTTAIDSLGDDPSNLSKLEEIRSSEIGEKPATDTAAGPDTPPATPDTAKADPAPSTTPAAGLPDLKGYKSQAELLKAFDEQKALIERQTGFIKEKLSSSTDATPQVTAAMQRAERAEQELQRLKAQGAAPSQGTATDIAIVQSEIQRIEALQADLDARADADPDVAYNPEYQKSMRELAKLQTKHLTSLTGLYQQAQAEIQKTATATNGFLESSQQAKEVEAASKARQALYDQMSTLDVPELKLSKKAEDVENEYLQWRNDVSLAFYGRPAANSAEQFAALEQLQLKNPDLVSKCKLLGVASEPTQDVSRYIQNCEYIDYMDGYRKDAASGKWIRLEKYDPVTQTRVPLVLPSLKAAIQQKRLEEGYYDKQVDGAFQKGAQSIAASAQRRDLGAVELDSRGDQGQVVQDGAWAMKVITEIDPEVAMQEFRQGNVAKVAELNKAREKLGMGPLQFN